MEIMTIDECWENCLAMWKWIANERRNGSKVHVGILKREWCKIHNFDNVHLDCFFCEFALGQCSKCPACQIEPDFTCGFRGANYLGKPIGFYECLVKLNEKRCA